MLFAELISCKFALREYDKLVSKKVHFGSSLIVLDFDVYCTILITVQNNLLICSIKCFNFRRNVFCFNISKSWYIKIDSIKFKTLVSFLRAFPIVFKNYNR